MKAPISRGSLVAHTLTLTAAILLIAAGHADAIFIGSVNLGTAGPDKYTLLTISTGTKLTANNESDITGNVGILGGAGKYSTSGNAFIAGTAYLAGPASIDPTRAANIVTNANALLNQAATDAFAASTFAAGLAPTITSGPPLSGPPATIESGFGNITITGVAGMNVIKLVNLRLSNNDILTLNGPAGASFVIDISGEFRIGGSTNGGRIELAGGLSPLSVLYNVTGTTDVNFTGGSTDHVPNAQVYGTVLAPNVSVKFTPGVVFGEIIGGGRELTLTSGSDALGAFTPLPEVSAFLPLLGLFTMACGSRIVGRRQRQESEVVDFGKSLS